MDLAKTTNQSTGHKKIKFADGGEIVYNHYNDELRNLTIGNINQRLTGEITFTDEANGITAFYKYDGYLMRKNDFIYGEIHRNGEKVSEISGNYMGHLDIDDKRFWDARDENVFFNIACEAENSLPS